MSTSSIRALSLLLLLATSVGLFSACGSSDPGPGQQSLEEEANEAPRDARAKEEPRDAGKKPVRLDGGEQHAPGSSMEEPERAEAGAAADKSEPPGSSGGCATFDSSYAAIQELIFERKGCTASACHGEKKVGGLDLRAPGSWENLVDVPSANSANMRVQPGTAAESFLYQKLSAATKPGSVEIAGSPMPVGTAPLTEDELEAVRLWILKGSPKTGAVADQTKNISVGSLLDACLPAATPVKAKPLEAPAPEEGIQFRLPRYTLKASSEVEQCTPFAYDFSDKVPAQYKDVARNVMFINGSRVRQDPQSHHMVVWNPNKQLSSVKVGDADWTCRGGDKEGKQCDASKGSADCGEEGACAGKTVSGTLCNLDPLDLLLGGGLPAQIANTQSPQQYTPPFDGVYSEIPLRGILWFNSHAFNLTEQDTQLDARVNYYYAKELEQEMRAVNVTDALSVAAGQPPFTRKTYCQKTVVPRDYSIAMMTGHTHRRGEHFWVSDSSGTKIYESFDYNDPEYKRYDPWVRFDAPSDAARTLEYCATFNNGLTKDDQPDLELVTRASRMPERTSCTAVACVAGKVKAACKVDSDCDSTPGKKDGDCDACPITGGVTTEDEMFVMMPWYVLPAKR
jgi:hypothetical protein